MDMGRPCGVQQRQRADGAPFWHKFTGESWLCPSHDRDIAKASPESQRLTFFTDFWTVFLMIFFWAGFFGRRLIGGMAANCAARPISISLSTVLVSADSRTSTKGNLR